MKGRGLQVLLVCSLVLNVFMIGGIAGAVIMWHRSAAQRPMAGGPGLGGARAGRLRQAAMALSPPYRRELRQTIRETLLQLQPEIAKSRDARLEAGRLLDQPTLDQAALQTALDQARATDMTIRTKLETAVVQFAASLPKNERAALAEGLAQLGPGIRPPPSQEAQP